MGKNRDVDPDETGHKRLSLHGIGFEEAVSDLLKVKPDETLTGSRRIDSKGSKPVDKSRRKKPR